MRDRNRRWMNPILVIGLVTTTLLNGPRATGQTAADLGSPASAGDLTPLNPDPKLLDVPTTKEQVTIDLSQPITLKQALELAQRNNRDVQVAELQLQQSQAELREAKAALLPTVSAQAGLTRTDSASARIANQLRRQAAEDAGVMPPPPASTVSNTFNTSVQATYDVFTSGQRSASIRAAEGAIRAAEDALETELQDLRLTVSNDYYDMQQADELVQIAQAAVGNAQKSLEDTKALERAGLGTKFDVLQAEVQLSDLQQQLTEALAQQEIARRQLSETLSIKETATLSAADPVAVAGTWPLTLEQSITLALQNRSELAEILEQRRIGQQNRRLIKGSFGPQASVSASASLADDLSDSVSIQPGYALGGQVTKLIFDGGATKANAQQQALNVKIAETQFANFKNLIRFQVEQNYFTLKSSLQNIQTNEQAVVQATESLRLARLRFTAGIGTQLEVSNAETDLTQAQSNLLSAKIDYNQALASLQRFVGTRLNRIEGTP
ncbi:MAG: TolC family protein [Thermosynechococcaceae cyanobacterium]